MSRRVAAVILACLVLAFSAVLALFAYARLMQYRPGEAVTVDFARETSQAGGQFDFLLGRGDFYLQTCCATSISYPVLDRRRVAAFRLRGRDHPVRGNFRAEGRLRSNPLGREAVYDFALSTPAVWPISNQRVIVAQWHATDDFFLLEPGRFPPLELAIEGNRWVIYKAWDARLRSADEGHGNTQGRALIGSAPFTPGRLVHWRIETRWATSAEGYVRAYKDGQLISDDQGPNAFRDLVGPYMKFGVYVPDWKKHIDPNAAEREAFYRRVSMVQR